MSASAEEAKDADVITTDDLQAMKAMIGDIKKDPSLLFRLSSLSFDVNNFSSVPAATTTCNTGRTTDNAIANEDVFVVDDDTTVVSALTMPSVGDLTYGGGGYPHHGAVAEEGRGSHMERVPSSSPTFRMGRGQYQSSSSFAQATATAVTRTNHDAEIALRMQSLRAGTNVRRLQQHHSTTPVKTLLPSISDEGRALARTPSSGGTRPKTNCSPFVGTSTSSKRHQVSSSSRSISTSCAIIMAAGSANHGDGSGLIPHGSRRQRQEQDTTKNIESENSHHAKALVLYERRKGNTEIDAQNLERCMKASSSQAIVARGNRYGKESTTNQPQTQQRQLSNQSVPSNSLAQYSLIPSPKSNKVHAEPTQRSVQAKNVQQPPFYNEERRSKQPSSSLSTSQRTSSRPNLDKRRDSNSSTYTTAETEITTSSSKTLIASFSSSSPALMTSVSQKHSPLKLGISHSGLNPKELSYDRRGQSVGRAGNYRGSNSVRNPHGRRVSSSHLVGQEKKHASSSSHRKTNIRCQSPPAKTTSASLMLTPIFSLGDGGTSSGESQLVDQSQLTPKSEAPATNHSHSISKHSQSMQLPFTNACRRWSSDELNETAVEQTSLRNGKDKTKSKGTRARAQTEPHVTTPVEGSEMPDTTVATEGNDEVSTLVNDHHVNNGIQLPQSPLSMSTSQSSLGHRLSQISMLDRSRQHDQRSDRSESGRSVISRLFSPMKRSVSSHDEGWVFGSEDNDSVQSSHGILLPKSHGVQTSNTVNISHSAPEVIVNVVEDDNCQNRVPVTALVNHETSLHSPGHRRYISNGDVISDSVTAGTNNLRGSQFCDERGRCQLHPHIRLLKPKIFGGWKVLLQYCPDCVLEQLKKNQENLTWMQLQQKREDEKKKRRSKREKERHQSSKRHADPIIGKYVGDVEFTPENGMVSIRHHTKDTKKHYEKLKQEGLPSPSEDALDKVESVVHENQRIDQEQMPSIKKDEGEQVPAPLPLPPPPSETTPQLPSIDPVVPQHELNTKRVNGLPWIDYNGNSGRYTGAVNDQFLPHGQGVMVYDRGSMSAGTWYNGVLDTEDSLSRSQIAVTEVPTPESEQLPAPARVLPNYAIGDTGRVEDMIIDSKKITAALIAETRAGDAAFVCRTDGRWTYAIAKSRTHGDNAAIKFKVNLRGSTKEFPSSQWGGFVRPIRQTPRASNNSEENRASAAGEESSLYNSLTSLGDFLDSQNGSSSSVAGNFMRQDSGISISSIQSAPHSINDMRGGSLHRSTQNLTTAKMKIPSRSRSRSRSRQRSLSTSFPNLLSSDMSVSEENVDGQMSDVWETASGSGYRLRGIDP